MIGSDAGWFLPEIGIGIKTTEKNPREVSIDVRDGCRRLVGVLPGGVGYWEGGREASNTGMPGASGPKVLERAGRAPRIRRQE